MKNAFNLTFFLRFLNRHRLYTAINVFGFSVSLTFVILIAAYVAKELSADRHHVNGDRIYRFEHQDFAYSAYAAGRVSRKSKVTASSLTKTRRYVSARNICK